MEPTNKTSFRHRPFPDYTHGEEMFNMASHLFGVICAIGMLVAVLCIPSDVITPGGRASGLIYVASVLLMFAVSSIYHGLPKSLGKQVMRTVDHCDIFVTIAGTYTPVALVGVASVDPVFGWIIFGLEWFFALIGIVLNAIDLRRFGKFSMICYLMMGWGIVICVKPTIASMTWAGLWWMIGGGIAFTIGALLYLVGKKRRYMHSIFHIFVVIGIVTQFIGVFRYLLWPAA